MAEVFKSGDEVLDTIWDLVLDGWVRAGLDQARGPGETDLVLYPTVDGVCRQARDQQEAA